MKINKNLRQKSFEVAMRELIFQSNKLQSPSFLLVLKLPCSHVIYLFFPSFHKKKTSINIYWQYTAGCTVDVVFTHCNR